MADTKTASWGIPGTSPTGYGIITDLSTSNEPIYQTLQDEQGATIDSTKYDTHYTFSMTLQVKSDVTPPASGSEISYDDKLYYVKRVERLYSNRDYQKLRVEGEAYDNWPKAN